MRESAATTSSWSDSSIRVWSGSDSSRKMARAAERSATALVRFTSSDGGTRADWNTSYSGRYYDIVRNDHFTRDCEGTGALEALLVAAVTG